MRRAITIVMVGLITSGCRTDKADASPDADTGGSNDGGSTEPGMTGGCDIIEETPLELDGTTPDDKSITNMVYTAIGDQNASLLWANVTDGTKVGIKFEISDPRNLRFLDYEVAPDETGATIEIACPDVFAFDARVVVTTNDGRLDEVFDSITLTGQDGVGAPMMSLDLSSPEGTLDIASWSDDTHDSVTATLDADWNENGIYGDIYGIGETRSGDFVTAFRFDIGQFSTDGF